MIKGIFEHGAMQSVERLVQFTGARHRVIANNIANISTPNFRPRDLSVAGFQKELGRAIDQRRSGTGAQDGPLRLSRTRELAFHADRTEAKPGFADQNIMFHDRNNRDVERIMQDLAENTMAHNAGIEILRNQFALLESAIQERV